ncbi:MAG: putative system TPR-repeat lipoprotein [Francisellaceae bacterium]|nr:putative system TPR-repeat lipoprotein [Francisellaceae bacterium]
MMYVRKILGIIGILVFTQTSFAMQNSGDKSNIDKKALITQSLASAQSNLKQHKPLLAQKAFLKAKSLGASPQEWLIPLGQAYLMGKNYSEVLSEIVAPSAYLNAFSKEEVLYIQILHAQANLGLKNIAAAKNILSTILQISPEHPQALLSLTQTHLIMKDSEKAQVYLEKAFHVAQSPRDKAQAWALKGQVYRKKDDKENAYLSYKNSLAFDPDNGSAKLGMAELKALEYSKDQSLEDAIDFYPYSRQIES